MILTVLFAFITLYLVGNVIKQLLHNLEVHQFFKKKAKNLVVLPNVSLVSGHLFQTTWSPKNWKNFQDLHAKYGRTFGMFMCQQPWVTTTDLDLIKLVMEKHYDRALLILPYKALRDSIFQATGATWKRVRRAVGPTMTNFKVRSELVTNDINHVVQQLEGWMNMMSRNSTESDSSFEADISHMSKRFSLACVVLVTYKRNNVVSFKGIRDPWTDDLDKANKVASNPLCMLTIMFPFLMPWADYVIKFTKFGRYLDQIVSFTEKSADMEAAAEKRKYMDRTSKEIDLKKARELRQRLSDEVSETYLAGKISYEELRGTMLLFIIAGFETVAGNLGNLLWQLAMHPDIQEKCREAILKEGFDAEYLFWCIMESLRIFPPVPLGPGRVLEYDVEYKEMKIPQGAFVMPSIYTIHHDPEFWPEPEKYLPERWAKSADFHPAQFLAFGMGARNCVGGRLAIHEVKLVIQMILTNYRIEKCRSTPEEYKFISPAMFITDLEEEVHLKFVPLQEQTT